MRLAFHGSSDTNDCEEQSSLFADKKNGGVSCYCVAWFYPSVTPYCEVLRWLQVGIDNAAPVLIMGQAREMCNIIVVVCIESSKEGSTALTPALHNIHVTCHLKSSALNNYNTCLNVSRSQKEQAPHCRFMHKRTFCGLASETTVALGAVQLPDLQISTTPCWNTKAPQ